MIRTSTIACMIMACSTVYLAASPFFLQSGVPSRAADSHDSTVASVLKSEVVVTGSPLETTRSKSIHRIRLIDNERIKSQQAVSLRDVLTNELNVSIQQDAVLGSGMSVQGIGGNGVKILLDGVPVVGRINGNVDVSQILLANAKRIEIVEGPMAVMYGTDAIGGVVNIITDKTSAESLTASAHTYIESIGTYNVDATLQGEVGGFALRANGGRNLFDGWSATDALKRSAQWKPREQYYVDVSIKPDVGDATLSYDLHVFDETILNRGEPRPPYGETAFDDRYMTQRLVNTLTGSLQLAPDLATHGTVAYTRYRREKLSTIKNLVTLEVTPIAGDGEQDTTTIDNVMGRFVGNILADTNTLNGTIGFEGTHEYMVSGRLTSATNAISDLAMFAEARYLPSKSVTIQLGGRGMWNSSFGTYAVPSIHTSWRATTNTTIRASLASGFRAPGMREMYLYFVDINHDIVGNPLLMPEKSVSANLSASTIITSSDWVVRLEGMAYANDVRNMITLAQTAGTQQYTYFNLGRLFTSGVEADASFTDDVVDATLGIVLAASSSNAEGTNIAPFVWTPQAKANVRWLLPLADLRLSVFAKYTGQQIRNVLAADGSLTSFTSDPFTIMDITVGRTFFDQALTVTAGCKNLFNVTNIAATASSGAHSSSGAMQPIAMGRFFSVDVGVTLR